MYGKTLKSILCVMLVALVLSACGGGGGNSDGNGAEAVTVKAMDTFKFDPPALTAKVGQTVNVTLDNQGVLDHNFVIQEFSVSLGPVPGGQTQNGSFTPAAAGTYTYYCDVPGHREAGMEGTLTVNP